MNIFDLPRVPLDPPSFIMQFDYPADEGIDLFDRLINSSERLIDYYVGRGDSATFVLEAFGSEITITSIGQGFIYDKFFGPFGGDIDLLPPFFVAIFENLEKTQHKTSFYVELPKEMDGDNKSRELLITHLTSILGGYCDYLPNCPNFEPLNDESKNVYVNQAENPECVLPNIESLILSGVNPT